MATQRGQKSAASIAVMPLPGKRHDPPKDLTPDQAAIWRKVAATKPRDWFTADSHPLLAAYCRHAATADLLAQQINVLEAAFDPASLAIYDRMLKMRAAEVKSLVSLATAMRCTQYSRYKSETAATEAISAGDSEKPWQL